MEFSDGATIALWSFTLTMLAINIRNMRPRPRNRHEMTELREEALRVLHASDKSNFEKTIDEHSIENAVQVEYLRLYVKYLAQYRSTDLNSLVESLRLARMQFKTNLKSHQLTDEQMKVYAEFSRVVTDLISEHDTEKDMLKRRSTILRTAFYTMGHMDQAEDILSIVKGRGVYDLKSVKALLKQMKDSPAAPLSDGML